MLRPNLIFGRIWTRPAEFEQARKAAEFEQGRPNLNKPGRIWTRPAEFEQEYKTIKNQYLTYNYLFSQPKLWLGSKK